MPTSVAPEYRPAESESNSLTGASEPHQRVMRRHGLVLLSHLSDQLQLDTAVARVRHKDGAHVSLAPVVGALHISHHKRLTRRDVTSASVVWKVLCEHSRRNCRVESLLVQHRKQYRHLD
jgi:hypothetical protein